MEMNTITNTKPKRELSAEERRMMENTILDTLFQTLASASSHAEASLLLYDRIMSRLCLESGQATLYRTAVERVAETDDLSIQLAYDFCVRRQLIDELNKEK